jgi:DUF4097 and DUF4098 domain-containing protein YvlB
MHRFDTPHPPTIRVEFRAGDITIEGQDTSETTVELTGRRDDQATRELLADTVVEQRGDVIVVHTPKRGAGFFGRTVQLDLRIVAPRGSSLAVRAGSADITTQGSLAGGRLDTGSGDVRITHMTDSLSVRTGSGEVSVDSTEADLDVKTGSGDIEVGSIAASGSLQAGSGQVSVGHVAGDARARTGSGDITIGDAERDVKAQTGSGSVRLGEVHRGRVRVIAASGDIHVGLAEGSAAWLDAHTLTGRVSSDLESTGEPTAEEEKVRLEVKTVSGNITVVRA